MKIGWGYAFLGMPEGAREQTRKITQGMTEYFIMPEPLMRRFTFLKGGQLWQKKSYANRSALYAPLHELQQ